MSGVLEHKLQSSAVLVKALHGEKVTKNSVRLGKSLRDICLGSRNSSPLDETSKPGGSHILDKGAKHVCTSVQLGRQA